MSAGVISFVFAFGFASLVLSLAMFGREEWFPAVYFMAIGIALLSLARQIYEVLL
uniref:Uncharacterized protein n=1 Tax=viral metagenome TaxID=1070528 RepID=A0A6M3LN28_9ZZZZ